MARRRSRFVAEGAVRDGKPCRNGVLHVLAYGLADACLTLDSYGVEYVRVAPYRPAVEAEGGFRLDRPAISRAGATLGLTLPVRVRTSARKGGCEGNYRLRRDGRTPTGIPTTVAPYHDIMVKSYLTPEAASRTLWHELAHAMQAKRSANATGQAIGHPVALAAAWEAHRAARGVAYQNKPYEVEARSFENRAAEHPLAKELSQC